MGTILAVMLLGGMPFQAIPNITNEAYDASVAFDTVVKEHKLQNIREVIVKAHYTYWSSDTSSVTLEFFVFADGGMTKFEIKRRKRKVDLNETWHRLAQMIKGKYKCKSWFYDGWGSYSYY